MMSRLLSPRATFPEAPGFQYVPPTGFKFAECFAERLWQLEEVRGLVDKAISSKYINGIANANLNPDLYGMYNLQDAVYLSKSLDNFKAVARNPNNTSALKGFYDHKVESYIGYRHDFFTTWRIAYESNADAVRLSPAATDYIAFERSVASPDPDGIYYNDPWYFLVANYPCYRLWPTIVQAVDAVHPNGIPGNVYQPWLDHNRSMGSAERLAGMIDKHAQQLDQEKAKQVFLTALAFEVQFFNEFAEGLV